MRYGSKAGIEDTAGRRDAVVSILLANAGRLREAGCDASRRSIALLALDQQPSQERVERAALGR
jgi:hypothetical protein